MNNIKNKGQVGIMAIIIGGVFTLMASIGGAWMAASASASKELSSVNTEVQLNKQREDIHYIELKGDNREMKSDIKDILKALNVISTYGKN